MTGKKILRVGVSRADITPAKEMPNYNGVRLDPGGEGNSLYCQALCLSAGKSPVVIIACDLTFMDRTLF